MSRIDKCEVCKLPFYVSEIGGKTVGCKESEEIKCPHCGNTTTEHSNGFFQTSKLSPEAEKNWIVEHT